MTAPVASLTSLIHGRSVTDDKSQVVFGEIRWAPGVRSSSLLKILTCICQTYSTFRRAKNVSWPTASLSCFKKCPSKSLSCVSVAVMALWKADRALKKKNPKKPTFTPLQVSLFPFKLAADGSKSTQRSFTNWQWWEMKTSLLLQKHHASACTYHILKSHPVPLGHVTFQNATVNDSLAHGRSPEGEMNPKHFTLLPAILAQLICMSNYCHLSPSSDGSPIMCTW